MSADAPPPLGDRDGGPPATSLIADDEPLLRERLAGLLAGLWPRLHIVAQARHGREAIEAFDRWRPDVAFLDVHMPGLNGLDAARHIARRAEVVFVTAHDRYAVQAFEAGALDYLVKPFEPARLADTVSRLQARLASRPARGADASPAPGERAAMPPTDAYAALLDELARRLAAPGAPVADAAPSTGRHLRWIRASVGAGVRLIPVDQVVYLRSDDKYTLVVWDGGEALIRRTIRELADELDPQSHVQVHRSVIVNLHRVTQVTRGANDTAELHLAGRPETLPVSRPYLHLFRQM